MGYMVAGYLIIWLAAFAFIFSMIKRQRDLEREVAMLKELIRERASQGGGTDW
jgi:CcmD family protein